MALDYFLAYGEAHSGSFIFAAAVQSLEWGEDLAEVLLIEAYAVILDNDLTILNRYGIRSAPGRSASRPVCEI